MFQEALERGRVVADIRSLFRVLADIMLYRVLFFVDLPPRQRQIRVHGDWTLRYRLNRGDIHTIDEVWVRETYRPPVEPRSVRTIVDLGANIGLASVYLATRFSCERVLAVEPFPPNARLARQNLSSNRIPGEVIEAAVGDADGTVRFEATRDFNAGRVSTTGLEVRMICMASLLERLPAATAVDLVKMDIEGSEERLLTGDLTWLGRVRALMVEFHPERVDKPSLIRVLLDRGFDYIPAGSRARPGPQPRGFGKSAVDTFVRP